MDRASCCNQLSTEAESEWKIPKHTLKGQDNFLERFGTQHNEFCTENGNRNQEEAPSSPTVPLKCGERAGEELCYSFSARLRTFFFISQE